MRRKLILLGIISLLMTSSATAQDEIELDPTKIGVTIGDTFIFEVTKFDVEGDDGYYLGFDYENFTSIEVPEGTEFTVEVIGDPVEEWTDNYEMPFEVTVVDTTYEFNNSMYIGDFVVFTHWEYWEEDTLGWMLFGFLLLPGFKYSIFQTDTEFIVQNSYSYTDENGSYSGEYEVRHDLETGVLNYERDTEVEDSNIDVINDEQIVKRKGYEFTEIKGPDSDSDDGFLIYNPIFPIFGIITHGLFLRYKRKL